MRLIAFICLISVCLGCHSSKHAITTSVTKDLEGAWQPISEEMGGKVLPKTAFDRQMLMLHDSTYTLAAESTDKGIVQYKGDKMDIFGKEGVNAGRHFTAIYKSAGDELTICYNLDGDSYPMSFDTKDKPMFFMAVFKKTRTWTPTPQRSGAPGRAAPPVR